MNDAGGVYPPEGKVKRFLDSVAYCLLIGNTSGIETDYKKVMHARREIPVSNCPAFVENMLYATGGTTNAIDQEECAGFRVMVDELDASAEKYEKQKVRREPAESRYHKHNRLNIHGGEWCFVDTDGVFEYRGDRYRIDPYAVQYQPIATEFGDLYDMDRILVTGDPPYKFYDMAYNEVTVKKI